MIETRSKLRESLYSLKMVKIALQLEYDGTNYHGFQVQVNKPTIQGILENAIFNLTNEYTRVFVASRTDAGVHARGQVVSFRTNTELPTKVFVSGLNYYLPVDIVVKEAYRINDDLNIRRDASSREYHYSILNSLTRSPLRGNYCYWVKGELNTIIMNQACQLLIGKQDLASFASSLGNNYGSTVRQVYRAEAVRENDMVILKIEANSFLPHQIRNTVGILIRLGQGKIGIEDFSKIMNARIPGLAGPSAPALGLCLMRINYN